MFSGGSGSTWTADVFANVCLPETKLKRSKIVFSVTLVVFTVVAICTELLHLSALSLIDSPVPSSDVVKGCRKSHADDTNCNFEH